MKLRNYILRILLIFLFQLNILIAQNVSDRTRYLIESIDLDSMKFNPSDPANEFQEKMSNYMTALMELNTKTQEVIQLIGPFEFESISVLSEPKNIVILQENLKQYKKVKKEYYDTFDSLYKNANIAIGKEHLNEKRLGGGLAFYEERLELFYLYDLHRYYDFLIKNHQYFVFENENINGTDDTIIDQYNVIWESLLESSENINKASDLKNNLIIDRISELKDWLDKK